MFMLAPLFSAIRKWRLGVYPTSPPGDIELGVAWDALEPRAFKLLDLFTALDQWLSPTGERPFELERRTAVLNAYKALIEKDREVDYIFQKLKHLSEYHYGEPRTGGAWKVALPDCEHLPSHIQDKHVCELWMDSAGNFTAKSWRESHNNGSRYDDTEDCLGRGSAAMVLEIMGIMEKDYFAKELERLHKAEKERINDLLRARIESPDERWGLVPPSVPTKPGTN